MASTLSDHPQNTARRVGFKAYLTGDHVTPATGKTIAVTISKNLGAFGNPAGGPTNATEDAQGWYFVDLAGGDHDTLGPFGLMGTEGTIDLVDLTYDVVTGAPPPAGGRVKGDIVPHVTLGRRVHLRLRPAPAGTRR
jgi:hypothetical protein